MGWGSWRELLKRVGGTLAVLTVIGILGTGADLVKKFEAVGYGVVATVLLFCLVLVIGFVSTLSKLDREHRKEIAGLRNQLEAKAESSESVARLENAYEQGRQILQNRESEKGHPHTWRRSIIDWFLRTESLLVQHAPDELFLFKTINEIPDEGTTFDSCETRLSQRLDKLRLIIGRKHQG